MAAASKRGDLKYLNGVGEDVLIRPKSLIRPGGQSEVHEISTASVILSTTLAIKFYHAAVAISAQGALFRNVGSRTRAPSASD